MTSKLSSNLVHAVAHSRQGIIGRNSLDPIGCSKRFSGEPLPPGLPTERGATESFTVGLILGVLFGSDSAYPFSPQSFLARRLIMLGRTQRSLLRTATRNASSSSSAPVSSLALTKRARSTDVTQNAISPEAKARVREQSRNIQSSAKTPAQLAL